MNRWRRGLAKFHGERVVLQTKDEQTLRGVVVAVYKDSVALGHFEYLEADTVEASPIGEATPEARAFGLPGEALVMFENLSWTHKLGSD
jgi:hypothetical protein